MHRRLRIVAAFLDQFRATDIPGTCARQAFLLRDDRTGSVRTFSGGSMNTPFHGGRPLAGNRGATRARPDDTAQDLIAQRDPRAIITVHFAGTTRDDPLVRPRTPA
jgi:hypothetical protein